MEKEKKEKEIYFSLFFSNPLHRVLHYIVSSKYICTRTYFVFVLSVTLRKGTYLPCQECGSRLITWKRLSWYSFFIKNSFSLTVSGTRIISFLYLIREVSTVLRKSKLFPHERAVLSRNLIHADVVSQRYPLRIIVCRWFNKCLKPNASVLW